MLDHLTLHVRNVNESLFFYSAALAPLGYVEKVRHGETVGLGVDDGTPRADFYIAPHVAGTVAPTTPVTHIAFRAQTPDEVRNFYAAAIAAGGKDNGKPGLRDYHPGYFAAFVLDPDGNNIEAVTNWSLNTGTEPSGAKPEPYQRFA